MISLREAVLLGLAALAAFSPVLKAPFFLDDHALLVDPVITSPGGWMKLWRLEQTRPLTWLSFRVSYQLGGADALGYHAWNLALHLLAVLLLRDTLERLLPWRAAVIGGFFFALHPIQTEAVAYVFARATLLAALLCVASLHCWVRGKHGGAVLCFAAALLAKEECAAFPVFLLMLQRSTSSREAELRSIFAMLGMAVLAVGRVAWVASSTPGSGAGAQAGVSCWEYLSTQGLAVLRYLQLLVIPLGFSFESPLQITSGWKAAAAWLAVLALAAVAARRFNAAREGFWVLGGLILLAPTSSVFPAADLSADRRMYLPMIAFSAAAGLVLQRTQFPILLAAGAIVFGMLSYVRAGVWADPQALWAESVRMAPGKTRPVIQLSRHLPPAQALPLLLEARKNTPNDAAMASELGKVYLELGRPGDAVQEFGRALALQPHDAAALNNRGTALLLLGLRDHAIGDFQRAAQEDPCLKAAHENLRRAGIASHAPERCRW